MEEVFGFITNPFFTTLFLLALGAVTGWFVRKEFEVKRDRKAKKNE